MFGNGHYRKVVVIMRGHVSLAIPYAPRVRARYDGGENKG